MNIKYCTITGADDKTDLDAMRKLQDDFPFVEWGILVGSPSNAGQPRWPCNRWVVDLFNYPGNGSFGAKYIRRAIHLCGQPLRELLLGNIHDRFMPYALASRDQTITVQLNTHGERHDLSVAGIELIRDLQITPIVQLDGQNTHILTALRKACPNVRAIFDMSHGTGVLPQSWPFPIAGVHCTYAGGLSPVRLGDHLKQMEEMAGEVEFSIDMETHVRSNVPGQGDILDMGKVVEVLSIVNNFTRKIP